MKLSLAALGRHLESPLLPLYWISGDEALLVEEAIHSLKQRAKQQAYSDFHTLDAHQTGSLESATQLSQNLSLFAEKQVIELQCLSSPNEKVLRWIEAYCARPSTDTLIIVRSPKLSGAQQNSAWYKLVDKVGAHLAIWPIDSKDLPQWLQHRAHKCGLKLQLDAAQYLANRTEGNLLAASGEIEKLALNDHQATITASMLARILEDHARFDVFNLSSAVLKGEAPRAWRIYTHLTTDSSEYTLILWALSKELRTLIHLHLGRKQAPLASLYKKHQVWDKRIPEIQAALNRLSLADCQNLLQRASQIDLAIKGLLPKEDPAQLLLAWVMEMAGFKFR